ncbi:MAG: AAA family ATPase [Chitinophagaceae bacterium]|nr:AAA family ATPase [Chitinophagaceae bacterium]MCA6456000.1 AAA family ATPase [Chitinophagaceae bacterium]MCA6460479.1 AAA family ATPase [Chitinophagaceae bacterium]MCA6464175.1 AAA family ATPase [Chitinophagaceae bacterium]MEA3427542.1 AAA family ATPase [Bacteroidota bacterium]
MIKKVVIIGPESTGKSTLCELLAQHYRMQWCPEFAREYLLTNGKEYQFDDLLTIAKGQLALEDEYTNLVNSQWAKVNERTWVNPHSLETSQQTPLLFVDTDMYVMKVWCEYVFGQCHQFILDQIVERRYDLYLLCNTDLPWVKDELREYPDEKNRKELYHIYKDLLINQSVPWVEITGGYDDRLTTSIAAIAEYL